MSERVSFRDAVAKFLREHPGEWIGAVAFERIGGRQAWRTRISECRRELGMTIENRTRRVRESDCDGIGREYTFSEYRYVPKVDVDFRSEATSGSMLFEWRDE